MINSRSGFILLDILLAFFLASLFVAIISESSLDSREMFERAKNRNILLDEYISEPDKFTQVKDYGNDMIQKIILDGDIQFNGLEMSSSTDTIQFEGTPLCDVDYKEDKKSMLINSVNLGINPSIPLTDIQVRNNIAYISADSALSSDPDLLVFDIHDKLNPVLLSSINTGPGITRLSLAQNHVYGAATSIAAQLHVIRINSPNSLFLEAKYKLPLPYATATAPLASSIFFNNNKIYLGTEKWDGDEFNIIDVSNPSIPLKIDGVEIGSKVNAITVARRGLATAYVASANQFQLSEIDLDHTPAPILNIYNPSGWQRQEGNVLSIFENNLNFGRTSGGYNIVSDHEIFNWATSSLSTLSNPYSLDVAGGVYGIVADRKHIFIATRQTGKEFWVLDRINGSDNGIAASSTYSLTVSPQSMTCDGDKIYILAHDSPIILEISFI